MDDPNITLWPKCDVIPSTGLKDMGRDRPNGTFFDKHWPPSWMCHSDRTGCWTRVSPNWKEAISSISAKIHHMPERYERVLVGWHCVKFKGRVELKIEKPRVKTLSYDFPKLHHSNPSSFHGKVHLCQLRIQLVVELELALIERKQFCRFRHKSIICQKDTKGFA